jgi:methylated-DNA-protein-cysteine methyltransferase-like protein
MSPGAGSAPVFERIYHVVGHIPRGRVSTYGTIALLAMGRAGGARTVGWALHGLRAEQAERVPWWRVINAQGRISTSCREHSSEEQRARLEAEGVRLDLDGRVDLDCYGWYGEPPAAAGT